MRTAIGIGGLVMVGLLSGCVKEELPVPKQVRSVNGSVDLNTATQPVNVFVMTNQGLMANLTVEGTKVTKLKTL